MPANFIIRKQMVSEWGLGICEVQGGMIESVVFGSVMSTQK